MNISSCGEKPLVVDIGHPCEKFCTMDKKEKNI